MSSSEALPYLELQIPRLFVDISKMNYMAQLLIAAAIAAVRKMAFRNAFQVWFLRRKQIDTGKSCMLDALSVSYRIGR